ncbi:hypothetical protein HNP84_007857 [Thermocatellispora tengchongensis]|uniref:Uncharacterized protein n=1 Tax=Thermocatellispora tengchongensis TaxID=1073253 RepID=A0A840P9P5_9ACTN|nr:hypothetical protein [Thermocatellispora tengchongensis]MBB5138104.1 hypothetical protein [Thermocatellispora tengchongensis]
MYLHIITGTWPAWAITPGPIWWAVRRDPLPPRLRAAGLRPAIGRPSAVELVVELRAEDRTAQELGADDPGHRPSHQPTSAEWLDGRTPMPLQPSQRDKERP